MEDLFCLTGGLGVLHKIGFIIFDQTEGYIFNSISFEEGSFDLQRICIDYLQDRRKIIYRTGKITHGKICPGSLEETIIL